MRVYIIAGEASGDLLGARLIEALRPLHDNHFPDSTFELFGIGGRQMTKAGLSSLFPMEELALMGFAEIVPHLPRLLRRIRQTVKDIDALAPDVVITIDSPGFCFQVIRTLRKRYAKTGKPLPLLVHYVAPSVWAYKPSRAKKLARDYDHVLTLLPFEPPYFTAEGMGATFVGHPIVEQPQEGDGARFRTTHGISASAKLITLLPGSRGGEVTRHLPLLHEVSARLKQHFPALELAMPILPHLHDKVSRETAAWPLKLHLATQDEKWDAFEASEAAIAKSGTVTLELALARLPHGVFYKVHPATAAIMRKLIRTPFVTLVNILLEKAVVKEWLQEQATAENIAEDIGRLLADSPRQKEQLHAFDEALAMLGKGAFTPSHKAAETVLALFEKRELP